MAICSGLGLCILLTFCSKDWETCFVGKTASSAGLGSGKYLPFRENNRTANNPSSLNLLKLCHNWELPAGIEKEREKNLLLNQV